MLNDSIRFEGDALYCDAVAVAEIAATCGTPVYIYSLRRALHNLARIREAFSALRPHVHYSAKANANLALLRALGEAGAGVDAVSGGEIYKALRAGIAPEKIVFAGVGKTRDELRYALENGVGWFNVENVLELDHLNALAGELGREAARVALRLNPDVTANTHPYIATGHGGAKFGLTADTVADLLHRRDAYPNLHIAALHVHIGSQLGDVRETAQAVEKALVLIAPYSDIRTLNIGGGLPVAYHPGDDLPPFTAFADVLTPLLRGYEVILEPGRAIIADAGLLVAQVLYVKQQAGETMFITDASMAELLRPALYEAQHGIVPLHRGLGSGLVNVVGPVCETADVLGREIDLPSLRPGDLLAILDAGAYGMVMASNYNARPRPPEVVVSPDGASWSVARERETWADLVRGEAL
jgi:diaminopimelate decarboxylase